MEMNVLGTYFIAVTLLTLTPGVDTLLIIRNSSRGGWQDGAMSSLGICSGLFIHAIVSAVGISVILLNTAWAFSFLKIAGAGYLIWLGLSSFRTAFTGSNNLFQIDLPAGSKGFNMKRSFREGLLSNVLNPKTLVFYMAFLPGFIDPSHSAIKQSIALAGIHFGIAMIWQCFLSATVSRARLILQKPFMNKLFGGLTGSVMIFLGYKLISDS
jgi:threonine/homoserine/homoserine lactone efflux protein